MLVETATHDGAPAALIDLIYYLAVGVIAQAAAFLASLIAIRRRQAHSRLDIFIYQAVGSCRGRGCLHGLERRRSGRIDPACTRPLSDIVVWWGRTFDTRGFLLVSLAVFTAWTLLACYREMRLELKMRNGPLVWLAFLVFIGIYVAGFDAWLTSDKNVAGWDAVSLRLALAATTFIVLTYLMVCWSPRIACISAGSAARSLRAASARHGAGCRRG